MGFRLATAAAVTVLGVLVLSGLLALRVRAFVNCDTARDGLDAGELQLLTLLNNARQQAGVAPLQPSPNLNRAAAWMSEDIVRSGSFSHIDSLGRTPSQRARDCGYPWGAGENLARGFSSPQAAFNAWMQSPGHRANMLSSIYLVAGIGAYQGVWTLNLGSVVDAASTPAPTATRTATPTRTPTPTPTPMPTPIPTQLPRVAIPLFAGFNLVTYGGPPAPPQVALASLGNALIAVYRWDAVSRTWQRYLATGPAWASTITQLQPGEAYFIGVSEPATFEFELVP